MLCLLVEFRTKLLSVEVTNRLLDQTVLFELIQVYIYSRTEMRRSRLRPFRRLRKLRELCLDVDMCMLPKGALKDLLHLILLGTSFELLDFLESL
jgi:hypothetical protein